MLINYQAGYALIAVLVSNTIGIILCSMALHFLAITVVYYHKMQHKFAAQRTRLVARQMLAQDLYKYPKNVTRCTVGIDSCEPLITPSIQSLIQQRQIKATSDLLILHNHTNETVIYYLRKSVLNKSHEAIPKFALYRDDIVTNALAIAEDIQNFKVTIINEQQVRMGLTFINHRHMEFTCTLPHL